MHKRILIATDGTETSDKAIEEGLDLAVNFGAEVVGLYVIDETCLNIMDVGSYEFGKQREKTLKKAKDALAELENKAKNKGIHLSTIIKEGDPSIEITSIAAQQKADLIVLGCHRRTGLRKLVEKSISQGAIMNAHCPVMLAHS